jgi:hypothetical protein
LKVLKKRSSEKIRNEKTRRETPTAQRELACYINRDTRMEESRSTDNWYYKIIYLKIYLHHVRTHNLFVTFNKIHLINSYVKCKRNNLCQIVEIIASKLA